MRPFHVVVWALVVLLLCGACLWAYLNVRARRLSRRVGAFQCWSRRPSTMGPGPVR